MPRDKALSHERIIRAARDEFSEYGFDKASMRRIGQSFRETARHGVSERRKLTLLTFAYWVDATSGK